MLDLNSTNIKPVAALLIIGYLLLTTVRHAEQILTSIVKILFLFLLPQWSYFEFYSVIPQLFMVCFFVVLVFRYLPGFNGQIFISDLPRKFTSRLLGIMVSLVLISYALTYVVEQLEFKLRSSSHWEADIIAIKSIILSVLGLIEIIVVAIGFVRLIRSKASDGAVRLN